MPEIGAKITTWDNFAGGDYGTKGGERAPVGTFAANNMMVYANGMLGVRPGLRNITPASMPTGKLLALVTTPVVGKDGIFIIGNTVYRFDLGTPATAPTSIGTFAVTPTVPLHLFPYVDIFYVAVPGDKCYRIDPTNSTVTAVTGVGTSPPGRDVVILNGQMIVAGDGSDASNPLYRLRASKPGDVNDWSEGRFIDVGDNWQITGLRPQRNGLAILKRESAHFLTGYVGDPDTEVDRTAATATGTLQPYHAEMDDKELYHFIPVFQDSVAVFAGSAIDSDSFAHIKFHQHEHDEGVELPQLQGLTRMLGDRTTSTIAAIRGGNSQQMLLRHNGSWTKHDFDVTVSGMCSSNLSNSTLVLTDGGSAGSAAVIYFTNLSQNRPSLDSDDLSRPGDDSDTPLQGSAILPQWWSPDGREVKVRQVIVDFMVWDTGATELNHFEVGVRVLGRDANRGAASEIIYTTESNKPNPYNEDPAASAATGTMKRQVFDFNCDPGGGFEISVFDVRGCAIRAVTVMNDPRFVRPIN